MAFNFNDLEDSDVFDDIIADIHRQAKERVSESTDSIWVYERGNGQQTTLTSKVLKNGFMTNEEPYYMVHPFDHLPGCVWSYPVAQYLNYIVVSVAADFSLDDTVQIPDTLNPEHRPIIVFKHFHGDFTKNGEVIMDIDTQKKYRCANDTVLFMGVFKATKRSANTYSLEKIWDRLYLPISID